MKRLTVLMVTAAALALPVPALAANYTFIKIADDSGPCKRSFHAPMVLFDARRLRPLIMM